MQTCLLPNINENKSFVPKINISQQDNSLTAGNNLILFSPIKKKSELTNTKSWKSLDAVSINTKHTNGVTLARAIGE